MARLNAEEMACVKKLAEPFEGGYPGLRVSRGDKGRHVDELGPPGEKRDGILGVLERTPGVIHDPVHSGAGRYFAFRISPPVLQVASASRAS